MLDVKIDDKTVNDILEKAINKKVEELAHEKYFMTYNELASYLNISKPLIEERFIKNGLKFYKIGKKYLFKRNEVEEFLDNITAQMNEKNNDLMYFPRLSTNEWRGNSE